MTAAFDRRAGAVAAPVAQLRAEPDPPWWLRQFKEARRLVRDYANGVVHGADRWTRLPAAAIAIARARWRHGIGPRHYALFRLADLPPTAWDDFLTDSPSFKDLLRSQSPAAMHAVANDKAAFHAHCVAHGLPVPPLLAIVGSNGADAAVYDGVPVVADAGRLTELLARAPSALFAKQLDGTFGEGAFKVDRIGADDYTFDGRRGPAGALFDHLRDGERGRVQWLIQPRLANHAALQPLMSPHGLGTIRVNTCQTSGEPRILYALLKMTVGSNVADNFHGGSTGNLIAAIDLDSGWLAPARGSARTDWPVIRRVDRHPDTGAPIAGAVVPLWRDVVDVVLRAQRSLPALRSAGWDIAVTPDGPVLLEVNLTYSTDILQVAYGRGLRAELLRELGVAPDHGAA